VHVSAMVANKQLVNRTRAHMKRSSILAWLEYNETTRPVVIYSLFIFCSTEQPIVNGNLFEKTS
jgi:hypothetical protein